MEFLVAGCAAVSAGFFTNPLEVIKTRMQLQGELQKRGTHAIHYRNILHASLQICKHDGVLALQAGLVPALWVQFIMNGSRLGGYQLADNHEILRDPNGNMRLDRAVLVAGISGVVGHYASTPLHLVRTHQQSIAAKSIAVGYQRQQRSMMNALREIIKLHGVRGLFRGGVAIFPRAFVASASQLVSFDYCKQLLCKYDTFREHKKFSTLVASFVGGIAISVLTNPFDLILIRLYNQEVGSDGKGRMYRGYFDCVAKIYSKEGAIAFFKGIGPMYIRLGPHTVLTLVFWEWYKNIYVKIRLVE